jgi:hypothetical protein
MNATTRLALATLLPLAALLPAHAQQATLDKIKDSGSITLAYRESSM